MWYGKHGLGKNAGSFVGCVQYRSLWTPGPGQPGQDRQLALKDMGTALKVPFWLLHIIHAHILPEAVLNVRAAAGLEEGQEAPRLLQLPLLLCRQGGHGCGHVGGEGGLPQPLGRAAGRDGAGSGR